MNTQRQVSVHRKTSETDIQLTLNLDGAGQSNIETGIGFFDHMLTALTKHGLFNLDIMVKGDLHIDFHHTVEDVGITLGRNSHHIAEATFKATARALRMACEFDSRALHSIPSTKGVL